MKPFIFENHPHDILLEIIARLELADALAFLSVCRSFRKLSGSRYLWINLLERTQLRRRLACPVGLDISQSDIDSLRNIAHHTNRVQKSWNRECPRISRAVKSERYTLSSEIEPAAILAVIPGTSLVVMYTQENTQQVICCDVDGTQPSPGVYVGNISRRAHYDELGHHVIALAIGSQFDDEISLRILSLKYASGQTPKIQEVFQTPLDCPCRALFICKDVVGVIPYADDDSRLSIRATNFVSNISVNISVEIGYPVVISFSLEAALSSFDADPQRNSSYVFCSVLGCTPFIITAEDKSYEVHRCSPEALPYGKAVKWENGASIKGNLSRVAEINAIGPEDSYDLETAELKWSPTGLHAVFVQYCRGYGPKTLVCFWPATGSLSPPMCNNKVSVELVLEGRVGSYIQSRVSPWLVASSPSGTYAAVVLDRRDSGTSKHDPCLRLLHFMDGPPRLQSRELELPPYIDLEQIYAIALDERCGVVYLSHSLGDLFSVPYA